MSTMLESESQARADSNMAFGAGILLMIGGAVALAMALWTTLVTMLVLGGFLLAAGILQIVGAFVHKRRGRNMAVSLVGGVLSGIVGFAFLIRPGLSAVAVTSLLAIYFLAAGIFRLVEGFRLKHPDRGVRGWTIISGITTTLLGVFALLTWPLSSLWLVGTLIGVDLIFAGASMMSVGMFMRGRGRLQHGMGGQPTSATTPTSAL